MQEFQIHFNDWSRWLFGEVPFVFFIEAIIRCFVIYVLLLVSMRLMGKRMASQLSRNEMAAIVSLAAAIGVPLLSPDRGILPAFIIAIVVILISRTIANIAFKDQHFEEVTQGHMDLLAESGVLHFHNMKKSRITRERVMAQLRSRNVKHLGTVKRFYLEASGSFTLIVADKPRPGLSVLPIVDIEFRNRLKEKKDILVCTKCGNGKNTESGNICKNCGNEHWEPAVE